MGRNRMQRREARDFTVEANTMFTRFALKHGLHHNALEAPVEILWEFPVQPKLRHRIVLGLQNNDELNFGVGNFWSYFFPFADKCLEFERLIDKWVTGEARVVPVSGLLVQTLELQVSEDGVWTTAYAARSLGRRRISRDILTNATG